MSVATALRGLASKLEYKSGELSIADQKAVRIFNKIIGYAFGESSTGQSINIDRAMQLSTWWSCVRLISETIATMPLNVYRRKSDDSRVYAEELTLFALLKAMPNADHTAMEMIEGVVYFLIVDGNSYALKTRNSQGEVIALNLLNSFAMTVTRDRFTGVVLYKYRDQGKEITINEDDIWHVRGFGNGGLTGFSTLKFARQTLGMATAAEESAGAMFRQGIRPAGVVTTDTVLKGTQRQDFKDNVLEELKGTLNAGGTMLLEAGFKYSPVNLKADDLQMLESRGFNVEEICRWTQVPPILIGHQSGASMWGSGIEQINLFFLTYCLRPYMKRIETSITRCLIPPEKRAKYYAEFNSDALLIMDSKSRAELWSKYANNGFVSRNEVRRKENLPSSPDKGMDSFTVQTALIPIELLGEVAKLPAEKQVAPGAAVENPPTQE
jgi:HK97 family phage portal protein